MRANGPISELSVKNGGAELVVSAESYTHFKEFISKRMAHLESTDDPNKMYGVIGFDCEIAGTAAGGKLYLAMENFTLDLEIKYNVHSRASQNTLYGIIRFITWAQIGHKPKTDDIFWNVESIIETYAPSAPHPISGEERPLRPGDPRLDTRGMSSMIQGALNELAQTDIPDYVIDSIGPDMKKLWNSWYEWRYSQGEDDPLFTDEKQMSWEEYCKWHPVCEFTGVGGVEGNPLERMHIVSGGSDIADYEQPWNWIRALHSVHRRQHDHGWEIVLKDYPHMRGKINRARALAHKRGLEVTDG